MSLKAKIDKEFRRLAALGGSSPVTLSVDMEIGRLESDLVALDAIGCTFERFELQSDRLAGASLDQLKKLSQTLAAQISYLLEPISPIETDPDGCVVQMRSNPPHKDEDATSYYELLVRRGGSLSLCRYTKPNGGQRNIVSAHVTREVFQRLAGDFAAALG